MVTTIKNLVLVIIVISLLLINGYIEDPEPYLNSSFIQ